MQHMSVLKGGEGRGEGERDLDFTPTNRFLRGPLSTLFTPPVLAANQDESLVTSVPCLCKEGAVGGGYVAMLNRREFRATGAGIWRNRHVAVICSPGQSPLIMPIINKS